MAAAPLWQLDAVSLAPARLRDVTLAIEWGVTAIIGWSGAGKTSLLNVLAGFETPDGGRVSGAPRIAWVPQNGGLWPHSTAREHLEIVGAAPARADALLSAFDLAEKSAALPQQLSEGEQSRLAVARALASAAEVLVMDEPLVHVDPARVGKYWRVIREHLATTGGALVFATHLPETVLAEADRAVCLREGRVLHAGPVRELYAAPPTPELMNFLGPGNWLTPPDARRWLDEEWTAASCLRPERLVIEPASDARLHVSFARFMGSVEEVELRDLDSGETRTFYHRPRAARLAPGAPVAIRCLPA